MLRNGSDEHLPYSLSRWTDVPAAKWTWFRQRLDAGWFIGIDPATGIPDKWSLTPRTTEELVFWTKDPTNLIHDQALLTPYRVKVHVTVTGWEEEERGAPSLEEGAELLRIAASVYDVTWRFSPVPVVEDVLPRFTSILDVASKAGLDRVFLSFLQPNDLVPETRTQQQRSNLMLRMAAAALQKGVKVLLCNEDSGLEETHPNLSRGICAPSRSAKKERCGCSLAVDPFTQNEACVFNCSYCYASEKATAHKKRNTTRHLPIFQGGT